MLLLLDENLPKKLRKDFLGHQIFTMRERGWAGKSNGVLMQLMTEAKFDALITFDQNFKITHSPFLFWWLQIIAI